SVLNFSQPVYDMTFEVAVSDVDLRKLPPSWKISIPDKLAKLNPRLKGDANLRVVVKDGKAHTTGTGEGVIKPIPITLSLPADGKGFHFRLRRRCSNSSKCPRSRLSACRCRDAACGLTTTRPGRHGAPAAFASSGSGQSTAMAICSCRGARARWRPC